MKRSENPFYEPVAQVIRQDILLMLLGQGMGAGDEGGGK